MTEQEFNELLQNILNGIFINNQLTIVVRNANGDTDGETIIIDDTRALLLADSIKKNPYIKKVDLTFNDIGDIGAIALASITTLEELNLYGNKVKLDGALALMQNSLIKLNLGGNALLLNTEESVYCFKIINIIDALIKNKTIIDINLDNCFFSSEVIARLIKENTVIKILSLGDNNLTDEALKSIGKNTVLEELHLFGNNITDIGIQYALDNTHLKLLNLNNNKLTTEGLKYFIGSSFDSVWINNNELSLIELDYFYSAFEEAKKLRPQVSFQEDVEKQKAQVNIMTEEEYYAYLMGNAEYNNEID